MKIQIDKKRIILKTAIYVCVAIVLAAAFRTGGDSGGSGKGTDELPKPAESLVTVENEEIRQAPQKSNSTDTGAEPDSSDKSSQAPSAQQKSDTAHQAASANSVSDEKSGQSTDNPNAAAADTADDQKLICTISIKCGTALKSTALKKEKAAILPSDGVILETKAEFKDGESVFDVLRRETKNKKIHMEFSDTPGIGSAYIEGIGNLYEQDCGELSGWMYRVNDEFPKFSCSEYKLKRGDKVEWLYTCDLGKDIGGSNLK